MCCVFYFIHLICINHIAYGCSPVVLQHQHKKDINCSLFTIKWIKNKTKNVCCLLSVYMAWHQPTFYFTCSTYQRFNLLFVQFEYSRVFLFVVVLPFNMEFQMDMCIFYGFSRDGCKRVYTRLKICNIRNAYDCTFNSKLWFPMLTIMTIM